MVTLEVPSWDGMEMEIICTARRTLYDSRTFDMINSVLLFLLPLILMIVLYFRMGLVLRRSTGNPLGCTTPSNGITNSSGDPMTDSDSDSQLRSVNELESFPIPGPPREALRQKESPPHPPCLRAGAGANKKRPEGIETP
ncbi:unnamed protein product, partial [Allacma fusca]